AVEAMTTAQAALDAARVAEDAAAAAHRAHAVRGDLVAGEACPVCLQVVATIPSGKAPPAMTKARTARDKAEREARLAAEAHDAAANDERTARHAYDEARDSVAALKPPRRERSTSTLLAEWTALVEWAAADIDVRTEQVRGVSDKLETLSAQRSARLSELVEQCAAAGLEVPAGHEPAAVARESLGRTRA